MYSDNNIAVINMLHYDVKSSLERGEVFVRIDRGYSVLGNPFVLSNKEDAEERKNVIDKYAIWLKEQLLVENSPQALEIKRIQDLVASGKSVYFGCWCSPSACHGDVIKEVVLKGLGLAFEPVKKKTALEFLRRG